jgi:phenylalanyl-tRNA synthetase beta chain
MPAPDREPSRLAAIVTGSPSPSSWRGERQPGDFYWLKGVLEVLAGRLDVQLEVTPAEEPFLHPGRSAAVAVAGAHAGWIGEVHPAVAGDWDLPAATAFELDLAPLVAASRSGAAVYEDVTTHPAVLQDLAVVVDEGVPAERVLALVDEAGGELLRDVRIFDLYRGEQVGAGRKSLALRLEFRAPDRTLTDEEVAGHREAIESALAGIGGSIRA